MVRVLAFFDTQFHGSDAGWRRLREARPISRHHSALNSPSTLGQYDLTDPGQAAQVVAMARMAGIDGFVIDLHRGYRHDAGLLAPFCRDGFGLAFRLRNGPEPVAADALAEALRGVPACLLGGGIPLIIDRPKEWEDRAVATAQLRAAAAKAGLPGLYLIANAAEDKGRFLSSGFDSLIDPAPDEWHSCRPSNGASGLDHLEVLSGLKDSVTYLDRFFPYLLFTVSRMIHRDQRGKALPRVFAAFHNWLDHMEGGATHLVTNGHEAVDPHLFGLFVENAMLFAHNHFPAGERAVFLQSWNGWFDGSQIEPSLLDGDLVYNAARAAIDRGRYMIRTRGESPEGLSAELTERIALLCEAARNL